MLARDIHTEEAAYALAAKLEQQLEAPISLTSMPLTETVAVSIGICIFPYKGATAIDVIRRADHAMYEIKRTRKNGSATMPFG